LNRNNSRWPFEALLILAEEEAANLYVLALIKLFDKPGGDFKTKNYKSGSHRPL
jgi:hypothetical protein